MDFGYNKVRPNFSHNIVLAGIRKNGCM